MTKEQGLEEKWQKEIDAEFERLVERKAKKILTQYKQLRKTHSSKEAYNEATAETIKLIVDNDYALDRFEEMMTAMESDIINEDYCDECKAEQTREALDTHKAIEELQDRCEELEESCGASKR